MSLIALKFVAAGLIAVAILTVAVGAWEWWEWRRG